MLQLFSKDGPNESYVPIFILLFRSSYIKYLTLWPTLTNGMWRKWDSALAASIFALVGSLKCHLQCPTTLYGVTEAPSLYGSLRREEPNCPNIPAEPASQLSAPRPQTCNWSHLGYSTPSLYLTTNTWKSTSKISARTSSQAPPTDRIMGNNKINICLATKCLVVCYIAI